MKAIYWIPLLLLLGSSALAGELRMVVTAEGIQLPASVQSGYTEIVLDNRASVPYANEILRVHDGADAEFIRQQLVAVFLGEADEEAEQEVFSNVTFISGAIVTMPGDSRSIGVVLEPGTYLVYADYPEDEGPGVELSHTAIVSVGEAAFPAPEPEAGLEIKLAEYAFALPAALSPGTHLARLENIGQEPHLGFIIKLPAGLTVEEVQSQLASGEEPDWDWLDWSTAQGVHVLGAGEVTWLELTFEPGASYVFDCPLPNDHGILHDELGMRQFVTIAAH